MVASVGRAEIVATCGASEGYGYFIPKRLVLPAESGWEGEKISKGSFQLIRSGDDWDIIFTDATGGTLSSRADGGSVSAVITEEGDTVVQVIYGGSVETYVFWFSLDVPVVTYSQAKFGMPVPKHSLMVAHCTLLPSLSTPPKGARE
jgi:hypothetical protein